MILYSSYILNRGTRYRMCPISFCEYTDLQLLLSNNAYKRPPSIQYFLTETLPSRATFSLYSYLLGSTIYYKQEATMNEQVV